MNELKAEGIYLNSLFLSYQHKAVLKDLSGVFKKGHFTALLGPNGGGKSTLLAALAGLIKPSAGEITRVGFKKECPPSYMAQGLDLRTELPVSVEAFVSLGLIHESGLFRSLKPQQEQKLQGALLALGLWELRDVNFHNLSLGQKRRAEWARVLLMDSELILLDEPFEAIDGEFKNKLLSILTELKAQKKTLIMALHQSEIARTFFDEYVLINGGVLEWGPMTSYQPQNRAPTWENLKF